MLYRVSIALRLEGITEEVIGIGVELAPTLTLAGVGVNLQGVSPSGRVGAVKGQILTRVFEARQLEDGGDVVVGADRVELKWCHNCPLSV
jgi:hypothetical protein